MVWVFLLVSIGAVGCVLTYIHEKIRQPLTLAFFHPHCEGGGGGERVLFQAIEALMNSGNRTPLRIKKIVIYAKKTSSSLDDILNNCRKSFQIKLDQRKNGIELELVQLKTVGLLNPKNYPRLTLVCQSIAEVIVGFEAMYKCLPEYYVDTTGCPFTYPVFAWIGGCNVACYVHYPTITAQMLQRVSDGYAMYNNADFIANNTFLTRGKLIYYRVFARLYYLCGFAPKVVMTNGSWTNDHIKMLWPANPKMVFPPVDIHLYKRGNKIRNRSPATILSVGQIRPEKNHKLQIEILKLLKESDVNVRLCVAGGCRNDEDTQRLQSLKDYAEELGVGEYIDWKINVTNEELRELNNTALIGIHTMIEEHFGIAVVESMAAGCIMVAHNSGGPKYDIVKELITGYLAEEAEEYATAIKKILESTDKELQYMRDQAIEDLEVFAVHNFSKKFLAALKDLK